jgi:hypothetical protein
MNKDSFMHQQNLCSTKKHQLFSLTGNEKALQQKFVDLLSSDKLYRFHLILNYLPSRAKLEL